MSKAPLFSTYRTGENRVTGSLIAVFQRIGVDLVERLLAAATGESSIELVAFTNQAAKGGPGVPDAVVSARFRYIFEVKTEANAVADRAAREQLERHLARLDGSFGDERLLVVTPDLVEPELIGAMGDERVVWIGFQSLAQAIDEVLEDQTEPASEQERFLLRELVGLFDAEGLLGIEDTVIVAARKAYPLYLEAAAYICQPNRSFRPNLQHLGFYTAKEIKPEIPRIRERFVDVTFTGDDADRYRRSDDPCERDLGSLMTRLLQSGSREPGINGDVFLLTPADHPDTIRLPAPIRHEANRAWTQGQRYARSDVLRKAPATTEELDDG